MDTLYQPSTTTSGLEGIAVTAHPAPAEISRSRRLAEHGPLIGVHSLSELRPRPSGVLSFRPPRYGFPMFELTEASPGPCTDSGDFWSRREGGFGKWAVAKMALRGLPVAVLFVFVGAASATQTRAAAGIPACPAGTIAAELRPCVISSWVEPEGKYGSRITMSLNGALSRKWVKASPTTGYAHWIYKAKFRVHDTVGLCPQPTPLTSIPCQNGGPSVSIRVYQEAKGTLQPAQSSLVSTTCNPAGTVCAVAFVIYPENVYGTLRMIGSAQVNQLTKNPANDLGQAGAQFPFSTYVAQVKKTP